MPISLMLFIITVGSILLLAVIFAGNYLLARVLNKLGDPSVWEKIREERLREKEIAEAQRGPDRLYRRHR